MLSIVNKAVNVLHDLSEVIDRLSNDEYCTKVESLNGSCIGEHTRHILEMFDELMVGYESGTVNYDNRKRNTELETFRDVAKQKIELITAQLPTNDRQLVLEQAFMTSSLQINLLATTYMRELVYNIEHTVHHKALIRVAIHALGLSNRIDESFGYADSTLVHRSKAKASN